MSPSPIRQRVLARRRIFAVHALLLGSFAVLASQCTSAIEVDCSSEALEIEGFATGYESCGEFRHRGTAESCPVFEHTAPSECADVSDDDEPICNSDGDCDAETFGQCLPNGQFGCRCVYGCSTDADCEEGAICVCGQPFGKCVRSTCGTDADCTHEGALCAESPTTVCNAVPVLEFACFVPQDDCHQDSECEPGAKCILGHDGVRTCQKPEACEVPPPAD